MLLHSTVYLASVLAWQKLVQPPPFCELSQALRLPFQVSHVSQTVAVGIC